MDLINAWRFVGAFLLVIGLIAGAAWLAKRFGLEKLLAGSVRRAGGRLAVEEALHLDARRKLVLIRRDDVTHLILVSQTGELLIESGIAPRAAQGEKKI